MPTHLLLDAAMEQKKGVNKIGSTLRGIGPTYRDKIGRAGLRIGEVLQPNFKDLYTEKKNAHIELLSLMQFDVNIEEQEKIWFEALDFITKNIPIIESENTIHQALKDHKHILAEGAQGTLLDIDFGSYPYVTSSNTITAGACTGLGIAPNTIGKVYGIFKAYCTRVGGGPFPTELNDETGETIRKIGNEFGATTGRSRRTGWLDLVALKYAILLNGVTDLVMTKADVLSGFNEIKVCTSYTLNGEITTQMPFDLNDVTPNYETLPGWEQDLTGIRAIQDLPTNLTHYISWLEERLEVGIKVISVGPDRNQTMIK